MKYEEKDITTVERGVIAHGVNCMHTMGAGVARAIKRRWPRVYLSYIKISAEDQRNMLGDAQIVEIDKNQLYVVNAFTQYTCGPQPSDGTRYKYADEKAIYKSLKQAFSLAKKEHLPIYLPKLGAGLGGLVWELEVVPQIEALEALFEIEAIVCVYTP